MKHLAYVKSVNINIFIDCKFSIIKLSSNDVT